jgi:hypothetical protein
MLTARKTSCVTSSSGLRLELSSLTGPPVRTASSQNSAPRRQATPTIRIFAGWSTN